MPSGHLSLHFLMFTAGVGIPVMAATNAGLGRSLGSPLLAVAILCGVATLSAFVLLAFSYPAPIDRVWPKSVLVYLAGALFVFYIASITYSAPRIGLGNAIFLVLLGQVVCAAFIDHFGWIESSASPITERRLFGLILTGAGVFLARGDATL